MSLFQSNKRAEGHEDEPDEHGGKRRKDDNTASEALLNSAVLETVFKHFDTTHLKLFRTVCKAWNEEFCRGMRRRGSVSYVQAPGECSTLMEIVKRNQELQLPPTFQNMVLRIENKKMLCEIASVPLEVPIAKLCINEELDCRSPGSTRWMYALLRNCSSSLKSLKIPFCNIEIPESTRSSWELNFSLLEELVLTVDSRNLMDDDYNPRDPGAAVGSKSLSGALSFFSNLIKSAPKLSSLEICHNSGSFGNFLGCFELKKLRNLKIWTDVFDQGTIIALNKIEFENLTGLSLNSSLVVFNNSGVKQLLQRYSKTLKSLSVGDISFKLPACPNLKHLVVRHFTWNYYWDLSKYPALHSIEILGVDPSLSYTFKTCPATVKRVKIGWRENFSRATRAPLRNLYSFFAGSATIWELPDEYVEDFCDFVAAEKGGKGIRSLAIDVYPEEPCFTLLFLKKGLENIPRLHDLEELTLKNREMKLPFETWNSFSPHLLPNLHTLSYYNHSTDFEELPKELLPKFRLIGKVVLLRKQPVRFDRKAEDFFSKLPNATTRHEEEKGLEEASEELPD